jgi:hypothetical protein
MKNFIIGFILVFCLMSAWPAAAEGPLVRQTDPETNLSVCLSPTTTLDGWYGPVHVSWQEYTLIDLYIEFTEGVWLTIPAGAAYDVGAVASVAATARIGNLPIYVHFSGNVPDGFQLH